MKKVLLAMAVLLVLPWAMQAQCGFPTYATPREKRLPKYELEAGVGINYATEKLTANKVLPGPTAFVEVRRNIHSAPLDFALQTSFSTFNRDWNGVGKERFNSASVLAVYDLNFARGRKVNPFIGIGAGVGLAMDDLIVDTADFCVMPRVGIRIMRRFSVTANYQIMQKEHKQLSCRVGFIF